MRSARSHWIGVGAFAIGLAIASIGVYAACFGDSEVVSEYLFSEGDGSTAVNTGIDGDAGNLVLTNKADFDGNVPPPNLDEGWSIHLPEVGAGFPQPGLESTSGYDPLAGAVRFTLMAWVLRASSEIDLNTDACVVSDIGIGDGTTGAASGFELQLAGAEGLPVLRINNERAMTTTAGLAPTNGQWRHIAVVYDGTRSAADPLSRNVHFYLDGVQQGEGSILQGVSVGSNAVPLVVGNSSSGRGASSAMVGKVDDVILLYGVAPNAVGDGRTNETIRCYMSLNDDFEPPKIRPPADVWTNTSPGMCGNPNVALGLPVASDNCGVESVSSDAPSVFPAGTTPVVWTARDSAGNTAACTQLVVVTDQEAPGVVAPPDIQIATNRCPVASEAIELGTPSLSDNCSIASEFRTAPSVYAAGNSRVIWHAVDAAGNQGVDTQTVTIIDTRTEDAGTNSGANPAKSTRKGPGGGARSFSPNGVIYVDASRPDDSGNATNWASAKRTIQAAVDIAATGEVVLVTNGTYEIGTRVTPGNLLMNRVVITNNIEVRSVNGPAVTIIRGQGPRGTNAIRAVYMSAGRLIGFTVTNSHTRLDGDGSYDQNGGGICMYPSTNAVVSNCVITGNSAYDAAGAAWGNLYNCIIRGNSSERASGGVGAAKLFNCVVEGNSTLRYGGGIDQAVCANCTVVGNETVNGTGGGAYNSQSTNSIIWANTAPASGSNVYLLTSQYTCTAPLQSGNGNISDAPIFVDMTNSDYRLQSNSPCIDTGNNGFVPTGKDKDGNPRIMDGNADAQAVVDMGAYEYLKPGVDSDGDGMPDEWEAQHGFDPSSGLVVPFEWFRFDEGTGVAVRTWGNTYTGLVSGANGSNWVRGYTGGSNDFALWFDGADDYVQVPTNGQGSVITQGPFSVSAWVFQDAGMTSYYGTVFSDSGYNGTNGYLTGYSCRIDTNNNRASYFVGCSTNFNGCHQYSWRESYVGRWVHIVGTYTGTTMKMYVDGQHVQTASAIFAPVLNPQTRIGMGHVNAGASYWRGMIDDVRFYRGALGTQDVASLYEAYADADSDGLSNLSEYQAGSDPRDEDTDGDGLSDGDEVNIYGTNPLSTESDGDGINDDVEVFSLGLNPASPDTDHDGWRDGVDPDPKSRIWADWGNAREWPDGVTRVTNRYGPVWCKEAAIFYGGSNDYAASSFAVSSNGSAGAVGFVLFTNLVGGTNLALWTRVDTNLSGQLYFQLRNLAWGNVLNKFSSSPHNPQYPDMINPANLAADNGEILLHVPMASAPDGANIIHHYWSGDLAIYDSMLYMDADGDFLDDTQVAAITANPTNDYDADGMADCWEYIHGLDFTSPDQNGNSQIDGQEDFDGDGLTNAQESGYGTNPNEQDTDGDDLPDDDEVLIHGTNPNQIDTDQDGLPDGWEVAYAAYGVNPVLSATNSLVGWWKLDEGSGTNAYNSATNAYHGTLNGFSFTPQSGWTTNGRFGGAVQFDGLNDWIRIPKDGALLPGSAFTMSAQVYLDADCPDDWPVVVSDMDTTNWNGYGLWFSPSYTAYAMIGSYGVKESSTGYSNSWVWIAMEYDGSFLHLYTNGVSAGTPVSVTFTGNNNDYFNIGDGQDPAYAEHWKGKIDDVRLYRSALGANGIAAMSDAYEDPDGDGLLNLQEYYAGTRPDLADTDGDGMNDKAEVDQGFDPLAPNEAAMIWIQYPENGRRIP